MGKISRKYFHSCIGTACFFLFLCASHSVVFATEQQLVHVVLLWLKEPGNQEHRQQFINDSQQFINIPGVLDLRIGQPVMSERNIVDDSFDVGLYVTVKNKEALEIYLNHPIHTKAVERTKPIAKKFLVYDFISEDATD